MKKKIIYLFLCVSEALFYLEDYLFSFPFFLTAQLQIRYLRGSLIVLFFS